MKSKKAETETDKAAETKTDKVAETVAPKPRKSGKEMPELFFEDNLRMDLIRSDFPRGPDGRIAWCEYQKRVWHERHAQLVVERREQIDKQRAAAEARIKVAQQQLDLLTYAQSQIER